MIEGFIHQQDKTILNMYIPTNKALTVTELKGKIYKATKVGNFQHTFLSNWQNFKSQQGFEHYKPTWPNRYTISPNNSKIHIVFKCTWNIHQHEPYSGPLKKNKTLLLGNKGGGKKNYLNLKGLKYYKECSLTVRELNWKDALLNI